MGQEGREGQGGARHDRLAVGALLAGATLWGLMWWPLRTFAEQGLGGLWLTLASYGIASAAVLPWVWRRRREWWGHWRGQALLMLFGGGTNVAFVLAILHGQVLRVLLLFYLSPIWAMLAGRFFLGEHIRRRGFLALGLALLGTWLVLGGGDGGRWHGLSGADTLAILSGVAFALGNVVLRWDQGLHDVHRAAAVWFGCVVVSALALPFAPGTVPAPGPGILAGLVLFALTWVSGATLIVQYGVSRMAVSRSAVILLWEVVAGALSSWWLVGEHFGWVEIGGAVLILAGAAVQARGG